LPFVELPKIKSLTATEGKKKERGEENVLLHVPKPVEFEVHPFVGHEFFVGALPPDPAVVHQAVKDQLSLR